MTLHDTLTRALSGSYTIRRELGGGGMSRVFLAEEDALRRAVVIKVLPPELSDGLNHERFQREIQLAATLQHPHIVPVFAAGRAETTPYFTMPFVEGESLRGRLGHGELPVAEAVSILRDVAKALQYAHQHGVVHRDIKPENILLTAGSAVVTDFGVAKALSESSTTSGSLTSMGVALGTPAYMAPEQAAADPSVDARADIYAFGVVAFEILTGRSPFAGRSPQQTLAAHMTETPRPVSEARPAIPAPLSALVARCLEKRASDRPQSAAEVLRELDSIMTPTGTVPVAALPRGGSRGRVAVMASAAAAAIVVSAIGVYLVRHAKAGASDGPTTSQSAMPTRFRPTSIAVAPFANMTGDSSLDVVGAIAAHTITDGLSQLDSIRVASVSESMTDSAGRLRHVATADAVRALGRATQSQTVVWGTYFRSGDSLSMRAALLDVSDGRERVTLSVTVDPKNPNKAIEAIRDRLLGAVDAAALSDRLGAIGHPPKVAAYREFLTGLKEFWTARSAAVRGAAAIPHFDAATRLDTTFLMAYHYAIMARTNIANSDAAAPDTIVRYNRAADSILKIIAPRRASFSGAESDLYDYTKAIANGDQAGEYESLKSMLKRDSSQRATGNAAGAALALNRPREALGFVNLWPWEKTTTALNMSSSAARAHHQLGEFDKAVAVAVRERKRQPGATGPFQQEIYSRAALGDSIGVAHMLDSLLAGWAPGDSLYPSSAFVYAVREFVAHHHDAQARYFATKGIAWIIVRPDSERKARLPTVAQLYYYIGERDSAFAVAAQLSKTSDTRMYLEAAQGRTARADTMLRFADSANALTPYYRGRAEMYKAHILSMMGKKEEAVAMLRKAMSLGVPFDFGADWHVDFTFIGLRDYPPFVALLKPKG